MAMNATRALNDVTVLLLGDVEAGHRQRAIEHYGRLGLRCQVLEPSDGLVAKLTERVSQVLRHVETPYVVMTLDADFVLAPAVAQAVVALDQQSDCIAAQGFSLGYSAADSVVKYYKMGSGSPAVMGRDAAARIEHHAAAERQAWRAVVRRSELETSLKGLPVDLDFTGWQLALSYQLLAQGRFVDLMQVDVVCEYLDHSGSTALSDRSRSLAMQTLRAHDECQLRLGGSDAGYELLNRFVVGTAGAICAPLLFTSRWTSVIDDPVREFEPRQYVELPYYNAELFAQLSALELMLHVWPTGKPHRFALEGTWVRQRDLLIEHPNDTPESLKERYWQAQALNLFNVEVNRRLLSTLTAEDERVHARELGGWLSRLEQYQGAGQAASLHDSESGRLLEALARAVPAAPERERLLVELKSRALPQLGFIILDLDDDSTALQATFDSFVASGLRNIKLVVLKAGKSPAITTSSDTLHFVEVSEANWISYLNHTVRQLPSEWMMLLRAGDVLTLGGALRLFQELADGPDCVAICANEIQRDQEGRLVEVARPGCDLDALRNRPDLMAAHWLIRRNVVVGLGGYSETHRHAFELDLLLRLAEQQGLCGLAHMDEFLVIGQAPSPLMLGDAVGTLERHLAVLGYQGRVSVQPEGHLLIDFRHGASPMVSIVLVAGSDAQQLRDCLISIIQRTRYNRYEIVLACSQDNQQVVAAAVPGLGARVRFVIGQAGSAADDLLNLAVGQAQGEHLVVLSQRCKVEAPGWIEALLNQALRPEVGVVGACLLDAAGLLLHAGYDMSISGQLGNHWLGMTADERAKTLWPGIVRGVRAVSADCLMIRKALFEQLDGLAPDQGGDIGLGSRVAASGLLVVWTPEAQLTASV
ncbi:glycosyl transferase [Pseudomonas sp. NPDC089401]|uniref:glycosyltransferase family 2 protein n=1 Tax=Pseudomonas sp. NPDC089401 TaxID=3364462 RepID=UPI003802C08B